MATLETPPNSTSAPPPPRAPEQPRDPAPPAKIQAGRYGELHQDELIHLLDSYNDERAKGRFRESIYISVIFYLALAWLVVFGPRVLFHQGRLITAKDAQHEKISSLEIPKIPTPKVPRIVPKPPVIDQKTMDKIKAMQPAPQPAPEPPAPAPQPAPPAATPPPPPAPTPQVQPRLPQQPQPSAIPDSPKPNFNVSQSAGDAVRNAARPSGLRGMGISGGSHTVGEHSASSGIEILSDPMNVDWGPYLRHLLAMVKASWYPLIPEECYPPLSKEGTTLIRFTINPDGSLKPNAMHLDDSTHDEAIDRAAWGSITGIGQFPPLPAEFKGPNLELRIQFIISRDPPRDR